MRRLRHEQPVGTRYLFVSERGASMTTRGFARGYKLANDRQDTRAIQDYLGHRNIQHTVRYAELASGRFAGFWQD